MLPRGALRSALLAALRQARAERPAEGATRPGSGHGEGALITEVRHGPAVGTLVERTTRLVLLARMEGTDARRAREGFTKKLRHVPALLRKPRPYDRGKELAEHERLAQRLAIPIFVADPYSPWQRGTHEHTNGLLRQYLPQNTDVSGYTQRALHAIAHRLNPRPRTCLNVATPRKPLRTCAIIHPLPLELEPARSFRDSAFLTA